MSIKPKRLFRSFFLFFLALSLYGPAITGLDASEPTAPYAARLSRSAIDSSLSLGLQYLINSQTSAGNFIYAYNVKTNKIIPDDNDVRQAGALWGLAGLHRAIGDPVSRAAVERGIDFFLRNSRVTAEGAKYVVYPGTSAGKTGTVALVSLALIDLLAAEPGLKDRYYPELEKYIRFLLSLRKPKGQFLASYDLKTGEGLGEEASPYYDGETLLALVRAAKENGMTELAPRILESAETMFWENVVNPFQLDPHSRTLKGFYQWGSMAYQEIFTSHWPGVKKYASRTLRMAAWAVKIERVAKRKINNGYSYEGLISAWEIARLTNDQKRLSWLTSVIDRGLYRLMSLQIGNPLSDTFSGNPVESDLLARGGGLRSYDDPVLRIDFTQHQMHALILARRYIYTKKS